MSQSGADTKRRLVESVDLSGVELRRMLVTDLAEVMQVETCAYAHPWSKTNFLDCLASGHECWLLRYQGGHLGHAVLSAAVGEAHLLNLTINPDHQRLGLGRKLLNYMQSRAVILSADTLFLEVRVSNTAAYELYVSEGFNEVGRRKDYYPASNRREDALILAIELN